MKVEDIKEFISDLENLAAVVKLVERHLGKGIVRNQNETQTLRDSAVKELQAVREKAAVVEAEYKQLDEATNEMLARTKSLAEAEADLAQSEKEFRESIAVKTDEIAAREKAIDDRRARLDQREKAVEAMAAEANGVASEYYSRLGEIEDFVSSQRRKDEMLN